MWTGTRREGVTFLASAATGWLLSLLIGVLRVLTGEADVSLFRPVRYPFSWSAFASILANGIEQEFVLLAAGSALLAAAGCRTWRVYVLGVVLRSLLFLNLGRLTPVACVYAAGQLWLYRRTGRLLPIAAAHTAVDARFLAGLL